MSEELEKHLIQRSLDIAVTNDSICAVSRLFYKGFYPSNWALRKITNEYVMVWILLHIKLDKSVVDHHFLNSKFCIIEKLLEFECTPSFEVFCKMCKKYID